MKQTLKIGITVLVVATLAMSGIALAQTNESTDETVKNVVTRIVKRLQSLVDDGTITAVQAEAVAAVLADGARPEARPEALPEALPEARPEGRSGNNGPNFGAIAEFLGMEVVEFRKALQEYDTPADLAVAKGSSGPQLISYLIDQASQRLDQAVADGKMEQAAADETLAEVTERITEMVNSEIPDKAGQRGPDRGEPGVLPSGDGAEISA